MSTPFFSTIIPVYNRRELIVPAIESALNQTFGDQEIIVVDDGSTDDTAGMMRQRYGERVRLLSQPNAGPGPARNTGIAAARGKYIAFLDSDDLWFPWTLACHREMIDRHGAAFISGSEATMDDYATLMANPPREPVAEKFSNLFAACENGFAVGGTPSVALPADTLRASGGFVDRRFNGEDTDLWLRLGTLCAFVKIHDPPLFACRRHVGRTSGDVRRTAEGIGYILRQERLGRYPGGEDCRRVRAGLLARFVRPASLDCLRDGALREAWSLYFAGFGPNAAARRFRYLAAFPFVAAAAALGWRGASAKEGH